MKNKSKIHYNKESGKAMPVKVEEITNGVLNTV